MDFEQGTIQICHTAVVNNGKVIYSDETKTATSCRRLPLTGAMREYLLEVKNAKQRIRLCLAVVMWIPDMSVWRGTALLSAPIQ